MKRFLLVLLIGIIVLLSLVFVVRQHRIPAHSAAPALLPPDTALFLQIPDAMKNREAWHQTDLYALYRELTVQEFLSKPMGRMSKQGGLVNAWSEAGTLRMRDVFLATNTFDTLRFVGGFEFRCDQKEANSVIEKWKSRLMAKAPGVQRTTIQYEKHSLDVITAGVMVASSFVENRFLVASNVDDLKTMLDRIDHRIKTPALDSDENFRAAIKEMPADYGWMFYLQPKQFAQKLAALRAQNGRVLPPDQQTILERVQSFSHAMIFEGKRIRDVEFAAMPRLVDGKLTRDTLSIASADTFLYIATLLNLQQQIDSAQQSGANAATAPVLRQITEALTAAGITQDDWKKAFGEEISALADWPAKLRLPTAVATLAVRDSARARKIIRALADASGWQSAVVDNVQYFSAPPGGSGLAISPTVAVAERMVVFGIDPASVRRGATQQPSGSLLTTSTSFKVAAGAVPEPQQTFVYLDLATLYSRLDATLRPILQMTAAFMPGFAERVDATKLPPVEVVTRHLSPVVAAQSYVGGGYRSESVGSITISQTIGVAAAAWIGTIALKNETGTILQGLAPSSSATPSRPSLSPSPSP
jgi:hypothetical protein